MIGKLKGQKDHVIYLPTSHWACHYQIGFIVSIKYGSDKSYIGMNGGIEVGHRSIVAKLSFNFNFHLVER